MHVAGHREKQCTATFISMNEGSHAFTFADDAEMS
jgi:hypothetical protein